MTYLKCPECGKFCNGHCKKCNYTMTYEEFCDQTETDRLW